MKIGIMGGTFDPIHNGHLMLGEAARDNFCLDRVWFMPNGNPPHKMRHTIESSIEDRINMVKLAIETREKFTLQLYEANKREISYSYSTLEFFLRQYPDDIFYFIIGADSLFAIETWNHPRRIFKSCIILAAFRDAVNTRAEMEDRIQYLTERYQAHIELLETPLLDISSHELRERVKEGDSIASYVPAPVDKYIRANHLYRRD